MRRAAALAVFVSGLTATSARAAVVFESNRCAGAPVQHEAGAGPPSGPGRCHYAIWRMADGGSGAVRLTDGGSERDNGDGEARFSPDGQRIVFVRSGESSRGGTRIW